MKKGSEQFNPVAWFDGAKSDYEAASPSRYVRQRTGMPSMGASADYHYRNQIDYLRMMEIARAMDRDDGYVGQAVNIACDNIADERFALDPKSPDEKFNEEIWERWEEWCEDPLLCDAAGERNFGAMAWMVQRHCFIDGDHLLIRTADGTLQMVEGHRLQSPHSMRNAPDVILGVKVDSFRRPISYLFTKQDLGVTASLKNMNEAREVRIRDRNDTQQVFHVKAAKRASQARGITAFAPVIQDCTMIEDLDFAKLLQSKIVSGIAFFIETQVGVPQASDGKGILGARSTATNAAGDTETQEEFRPAMYVNLPPGKKAVPFSPNVPNVEFFEFAKHVLTRIGLNLGLPLVMMLMDASETNFSGFRGAVDQARRSFKRIQNSLVLQLYRPIYIAKVQEWAIEDRAIRAVIKAHGSKAFAHKWNLPGFRYIEPFKDAQADDLRLKANLTSERRLYAERGMEYETVVEEATADRSLRISMAAKAAQTINAKFPDAKITWRDIVGPIEAAAVTTPAGGEEKDDDGGGEEVGEPAKKTPAKKSPAKKRGKAA